MLPQAANYELVRGNCELIPLSEARGRIALEGALPYPPGVITCVPGEVWEGWCSTTSSRLKRGEPASRIYA